MKENFSDFEIFAGKLILSFNIQAPLGSAASVRPGAHVHGTYLTLEKAVHC